MADDAFDPAQPLADKDDEAEVQREFKARERLKWLQTEADKKRGGGGPPKPRKGVFSGRD